MKNFKVESKFLKQGPVETLEMNQAKFLDCYVGENEEEIMSLEIGDIFEIEGFKVTRLLDI